LLTDRLIENDVRRTFEVYTSLADRYTLINAALAEEADALLRAAQSGYVEDEIPLVSLLDAAEAYRETHFAKINLYRDLQVAYFDLLRAAGASESQPIP
jgi:outer membrane protein TolC